MKSEAFFLTRKGEPEQTFELRSMDMVKPRGREVLIEVEAFGLNYADIMARRGLYGDAPPFPCVIGYEVVGKIAEIGDEVAQELLNTRVLAFCRFGGYARHVCTNDYATVPVGSQPAAELLALCTQAVTAYYMTDYLAPVHASDTVLIHAADGGVGSILIQLAKLRGATVIAKIGNDSKAALVKELGADFVVNYNKSDYSTEIEKFMKGAKIDVSYNPVAGSTFKKDLKLLGSGGRLVLFGGSEMGKAPWGIFSKLNFVRKMGLIIPVTLMMSSRNILGVNMLKIADDKPLVLEQCLTAVIKLYLENKLRPQVGGEYKSSELAEAHRALEEGRTTGKLSIHW